MKTTAKLLVGMIIPLLAACSAKPGTKQPISLASGGSSTYVISLDDKASAPEKNAATELATYLKKITGAEFPIVPFSEVGNRAVIAVGPGAAKQIAPTLDLSKTGNKGLGEDGIVLKTVGKNLILTGAEGSKRGTLYAVNEFLEREAGVRWWTPNEETVPSKPDLAVPVLDTRYKPPVFNREALTYAIRPLIWEQTSEVPKFAVRLRQNGHFFKIPADWGGHNTTLGWCHTFFASLIPPEKYFKDHPEWFSEIGGKRHWEKAQLCMTNEEMLQEMANNVRVQIKANPNAGVVAIDQNDWHGNCGCAECREIDVAEGSASGSLLHGVNRVAEILGPEFPDVMFTTLAYLYSRTPPAHLRPRENVMIRLAVIERTAAQPISNPANAPLLRDLDAWAKVADKLAIWDYSANLVIPFTPEPRFSVFGPDIRLYRDRGAISVYFEHTHSFCRVSDFEELNTWLIMRLMWNPDLDDSKLTDEFLAGYYGAAAPHLREYLNLLTDALGNTKIASYTQPDADWMSLETMNAAAGMFAKARAVVADDPALSARVDRAQTSLDHQWLLRYADYKHESERRKLPFLGPENFEAALKDFEARLGGFGVKELGYYGPDLISLRDYMKDLRESGQARSARPQLMEDPVYLDALNGKFLSLPEFLGLGEKDGVMQIQEAQLTLYGAKLAVDETASNHAASKMDPKKPSWSVQLRNPVQLGLGGRWRVLVEVRVDSDAKEGKAFIAGVYDEGARRALSQVNATLNAPATGQNRPMDPAADPRDGKYHLYDLGTHVIGSHTYVWVGTDEAVDPTKVRGVYVDRLIFVPER